MVSRSELLKSIKSCGLFKLKSFELILEALLHECLFFSFNNNLYNVIDVIEELCHQITYNKDFKHNIIFGNRAVDKVENLNVLLECLSYVELKPRVVIF